MDHLFKKIKALEPIPTGAEPDLRPLEGVKAVIFDIYGTLVISASGDIGSQDLKGQHALKALEECHIEVACSEDPMICAQSLIDLYEACIHDSHSSTREAHGHPHPEVDVVEIWKDLISRLEPEGKIASHPDDLDYEVLAFTFEMHQNAVYPMPTMTETLTKLHSADLTLGIVSNAQFFTPLLLKHFLDAPSDHHLPLFHPDLQVYSYEIERAKPDNHLYQLMRDHLAKVNLTPQQCLYVGNDMLNDIVPAKEEGFHTALFAGDLRSLRERKDHHRVLDHQPDRIVTRLDQILTITGLT